MNFKNSIPAHWKSISSDFYQRDSLLVAHSLIGCILVTNIDGMLRAGRIVETEAYGQDPASHSFGGKTDRNTAMFGPAGHLYTYISYGVHTCCNIVAHSKDQESGGVLLRAIEPLVGIEQMELARKLKGVQVSSGPGKLTVALGITMAHYGQKLDDQSEVSLWYDPDYQPNVVETTRIGISQAQDKL